MLATLVIGLREGLEAALIVGIIAAFLRKNGQSLTAMWLGVALAIILSIAVGVGLDLIEQALPQASQEGMESIIGAIAIVFVTGMILWMNANAGGMKRELEAGAAEALSLGSAYALAVMAFLAVLKEGFETAVFLLATFSAAQSAALAATGAVIGVLLAVAIGWGIYVGGVKLNLSKFFRVTGAFLILVAAGLVITSLRTAHEAGWLNAGQQGTVDLSWLVAPGTVQSALITGVLGIPPDPRLIEVMGWFAYLLPVTLVVFWPAARRPRRHAAIRLQWMIAAALAAGACLLAIAIPMPGPQRPGQAMIVATGPTQAGIGSARLRDGVPAQLQLSLKGAQDSTLSLPPGEARHEQHAGLNTAAWTITQTSLPAHAPTSLTLDQVVALAGRVPVGLNPQQHPGPFAADWSTQTTTSVWTADGVLLDAMGQANTIVSLSGSGLLSPRTLTASGIGPADWQVSNLYLDQATAAVNALAVARTERLLWAVELPIALALAALSLGVVAWRGSNRLRRTTAIVSTHSTPRAGHRAGHSTL